jgi:hypothetical protein
MTTFIRDRRFWRGFWEWGVSPILVGAVVTALVVVYDKW